MGGAWLTGGLQAIASETGWDPGSADYIVGTSAGAMMGALLGAGVPPWFMVAHSAGEVFEGLADANGRPVREASRSAGAVFRLHRGFPVPALGSPRLAMTGLLRGRRHSKGAAVLAAWLPRGFISTQPLKDVVRRAVPSGWADHPNLWIMACDYRTGDLVAFGREGAPKADLADAVAASCAIPGFYHPVTIAGRQYVDGGVISASNLDVLRDERLDLVICMNPTSSLHRHPGVWPHERLAAAIRAGSGRRLGREAKVLRARGTEVVLVQPTNADLAVMGTNLMSRRRRHQVIERALETVADQLRASPQRHLLKDLPKAPPHRLRRPPGPPSGWPQDAVPRRQRSA